MTPHPDCEPQHHCRGCGKPVLCGEDIVVPWRSGRRYVVRHADRDGPTGWRRVYHCSTACYWRQLRARRKEERTREVICGGKFQTPRRDARYCCAACRQDAYRRRKELHARLLADPRFREAPKPGTGVSIEEAVMEFITGGTRYMRAMRYIPHGAVPRTVPDGRVLAHNHVRHTVDMPNGRHGFWVWAWPKEKKPPNFVCCGCGYAGLPHYAFRDHANYRCESESVIAALD